MVKYNIALIRTDDTAQTHISYYIADDAETTEDPSEAFAYDNKELAISEAAIINSSWDLEPGLQFVAVEAPYQT